MPDKRRLAVILAVFLPWLPVQARAWTDETRARMVVQALELMPTSLKNVLKRERRHCIRGALAPSSTPPGEARHRSVTAEDLDRRIDRTARAVEAAVEAIHRHEPFGKIGYRFGEVAHWVADLNFPLNLPEGSGVAEPEVRRYREFVERAMERFQLVLDPSDPAMLVRGDLEAYLRSTGGRSGRYGPLLEEVYRLEAENPDPARFDDRSVAFGIASLSYSRSVSDISRVWLYIWDRSRGDMEGTPFPLVPSIPPTKAPRGREETP